MDYSSLLVPPRLVPPLDPEFRPASLSTRAFNKKAHGIGIPLVIGLERNDGEFSRYETSVFSGNHPEAKLNFYYVERLVKFLLWQRGGWRVYIGGPQIIGDYIKQIYSQQGERSFDANFLGRKVYEQEFTIEVCKIENVPPLHESGEPFGRHLDGYRIGFDLGASDRKVSAVVNGEAVFSEEVIWEPRKHSDPDYHFQEIMNSLRAAASKMPRVDAIGGSSAGIYINNRPMVASLFRSVPAERYADIRNLFERIQKEFNVPLEVINDGDVTALAGSMSLEDNAILGIAMGSSEATGYVDPSGFITGWMNELSFAPVDYNPSAPIEEWSGDRGCGSLYFSQQCVFRLAPKAGIQIPGEIPDAEKLLFVQEKLESGHEGAIKIWQTMGYYLGYALAHYADFYEVKHVLILGRCTSGRGGDLILEGAKDVLRVEFPELVNKFILQLPDEKSRRVGQSIAAASLPNLRKKS